MQKFDPKCNSYLKSTEHLARGCCFQHVREKNRDVVLISEEPVSYCKIKQKSSEDCKARVNQLCCKDLDELSVTKNFKNSCCKNQQFDSWNNNNVKSSKNISHKEQMKSGHRKPKPPVWLRSAALLHIKRTPETDKLPKVCPRFLLEKKTCWNRFQQVWEPLLNHFSQKQTSQYHHSDCPFHRGYEI